MLAIMSHSIVVGSYTTEVYTLVFDPADLSLALVAATTVGYHPSWIARHPIDRSVIFAVLAEQQGKMIAMKLGGNGDKILGETSSGGASPCCVVATPHALIISNVSF
jgi:hypothetical protein